MRRCHVPLCLGQQGRWHIGRQLRVESTGFLHRGRLTARLALVVVTETSSKPPRGPRATRLQQFGEECKRQLQRQYTVVQLLQSLAKHPVQSVVSVCVPGPE